MCEETTMRALWLLLGVAFLAGSGLGSRPGPGHDKLHCKCVLYEVYLLCIVLVN